MLLYMVTFTINIPPMLAYIPAPWILWVIIYIINYDVISTMNHSDCIVIGVI